MFTQLSQIRLFMVAKEIMYTTFCRFQLSAMHFLCPGVCFLYAQSQPATMSFIKSLSEVLGQAEISEHAFLPVRTCKTVYSQQH